MTANTGTRGLRAALLGAATFSAAALGLAAPASALVTPQGVTPASVVDTTNTRPYWVGLAIRGEAGNSGGTCTGLLINPRTVLFAAHCVDGLAPAAYDAPTAPGNRAQVGYTSDGTFGRDNLREWLFGQDFVVPAGDARVMDASSVMVWYDPRSRNGSAAIAGNGTFLPADIAIAGFDRASELLGRDAQSGIGLLFTPLSGLVPVTMGGFGTSGNGQDGTRTGAIDAQYQRRLGQNFLGFLGDERSIALGIYPGATADILEPPTATVYQDLYWADFDDPNRATRPFFNGPGSDPLCTVSPNFNCRLDHDPFPGNAVAGEAITGAGDSGSPLVTGAFGREVSLGVLSQGSRFFYESIGNENDNLVRFTDFSNYGTTAGYNPLFLFWDQIVVNNPYKYVRAAAGDGEWTDATRWVQELDPLYFTLAGSTLVNALPTTPALGVSSATPNVGTINPSPSPAATCAFTGTCPLTGGTGVPAVTDPVPVPANIAAPGVEDHGYRVTLEDVVPIAVTPGYEARIAGLASASSYSDTLYVGQPSSTESVGEATLAGVPASQANSNEGTIPGTPASTANTTALWSSGTLIAVNSGTLTGPGTTNFVPNNVLGTAGLQNSTRWFEVNLRNAGTTFLTGTTVTIDRLSVRAASAGLNIRSGARLNTNISSFLDAGTFTVNGIFAPSRLTVAGGLLTGTGSILTTATTGAGLLVNGGVLSPGTAAATVGTLAVTGNTAFALAGVYGVDLSSASLADRLNVTGALQLGGGLAVNTLGSYVPTFGTSWTIANGSTGVTGSFAAIATNLPGVLRPQVAVSGNNVILSIIALPFANAASYTSPEQRTVASALDLIRTQPGGYTALSSLFNSLDQTPTGALPATMESLVPLNGFVAEGVTQGLTGLMSDSVVDRADQMIQGTGHGFDAAGASAMLNASMLQASADPLDAMMMGATAVVAAQEAAAETAASAASIKLREGWGGFLDISTLIDSSYEATPFAGDADLTGTSGTLGFDYGFSDGAFAGFSVSYGNADADLTVPLQSAGADSWGVTVYGGVHEGESFLNGYLGYSAQSYDLSRTVPLILGNQVLTASPDGSTVSAGAKMGFDLTSSAGTFTPYASIDAKWIDMDGYTETGGSAALTFASTNTTVIDAHLGLEYTGTFDMGDGAMLRPKLGVAYVIDVQSDDNVLNTAFAAFPSAPLTFVGGARDKGWVEYQAGLEYVGANFGLALSYTGGDNGVLKANTLSGRVSFAW